MGNKHTKNHMTHSNFRWIIPNKLAASHSPNKKELKEYAKLGINTIVCLQTWERDNPFDFYDIPSYSLKDIKDNGMRLYHMPIPDASPPTDEQLDNFIRLADKPKNIILVHCHAGIGRTGCMIGAYLGHAKNLNGNDAIDLLREIWICYIQYPEQESAVKNYLDKQFTKK
jgi:protein tyrosine phosphatase (PTP) superfamily phosphohydrolase (DUF442 family)